MDAARDRDVLRALLARCLRDALPVLDAAPQRLHVTNFFISFVGFFSLKGKLYVYIISLCCPYVCPSVRFIAKRVIFFYDDYYFI